MAAKRRVHQVAKEFNISNEALIGFLADAGHDIHSPMTALTEEMYEIVSRRYKKSVEKKDQDLEFRQQIKERKREEDRGRQRARQELEERMRVASNLMEARARKARAAETEVVTASEDPSVVDGRSPLAPTVTPTTPGKRKGRAPRKPTIDASEPEAKTKDIDKEKTTPERGKKKDKRSLQDSIGSLIPKEDLLAEQKEDEVEAKETPGKQLAKPQKHAGDKESGETEEDQPAKKRRRRRRKKKKVAEAGEDGDSTVETANGKLAPAKEEIDGKRRRKKKKRKISEEEIQASIRETMAAMAGGTRSRVRRRRFREDSDEPVGEEERNVIEVAEFVSVSDLAKLMGIEPTEVIKSCLQLGMIVSINQRLDSDAIVMVADEFGFDVSLAKEYGSDVIESLDEPDDPASLRARSPVVTIMGHVDHGKTSLLDYLRKSSITSGESGGITQHIGAYEINFNGKEITFLDTPGHEAFTAMRARGAQVTDVVVLVVAADDGVQQQTLEAISHARAASVPVVIAINKMDKANANPDNTKQQLAKNGIMVESWGGKIQCAELSAKTGAGVDHLLELILLEAELLNLQANADRPATGVVIESELDKGKGPVATILVQNGTLRIGNVFIAGHQWGKVRAMYDEHGRRCKEAPPSTPVQVIGFSGVPSAGDNFAVMQVEQDAKDLALKRQQLKRIQDIQKRQHLTLDQFSQRMREGALKELLIIVKADVDGSMEALGDSLLKLSNNEVAVRVIHKAVGGISESDVLLAAASNAIIFGFHVRATQQAREIAERENVDIRIYKIIYDAVNHVKAALEGMLTPALSEEITSAIAVREIFKVPKFGTVAGCYVQTGKVHRNESIRVYRDDKLIHEGKIASLRRFKDDVREVASGFECGVKIEGYDDIHIGDILETFKVVETKRTLAMAS